MPAAAHTTEAQSSTTASRAVAHVVQTKVVIGPVDDPFEREADAVAEQVESGRTVSAISALPTGGLSTTTQRQATEEEEPVQRQTTEEEPVQRQAVEKEEPVQRQVVEKEEPVQRQALEEEKPVQRQAAEEEESVQAEPDGSGGAGTGPGMPAVASRAIQHKGSGLPMHPRTRHVLETRMGTDLSAVRVHSGGAAQEATSGLRARAFTHRNHIWLGRGESEQDLGLMAHESTHVVQQAAAVQSVPQVQRLFDFSLDDLPGIDAADIARRVPGYTLFTVVIGYNPLTNTEVERNAINLVQGMMELVPFGADIFDALNERGILQQAFAWVQGELYRLNLTRERIYRVLEEAWEAIDLVPPFSIVENLNHIIRVFRPLYDDVVAFALSLVTHIVDMIKEAALDVAEGLLAENRAWALIKKILGHDPLRDEPVDATPTEILEDFLILIGKEQHLEQMRARGTVEETANWLATQIATFLSLLGELRGLISRAWEAIQPENLPNLMSNLQTLALDVGGFLLRVWDFATTVAAEVLRLIKEALLGWLSDVAHEVPGFHLLTVILRRNPFTGEAVPRTAENLIRGFITLLPGGDAIYQQLSETGTIAGAAARIEGAMEELGINWEFIVGLFRGIWESLSIEDLIDPIGAFMRIVGQFGEPIARLFAFVSVVLREMFFIILEMMNFPTELIGSIISNAMQAIEDIKRDPIGFFSNMLAAVRLGFGNFFDNILQHLVGGLAAWLFRALRDSGVEPPADLTLPSILDFVLEALGITMENLWAKLAERIGQENVDRIQGALDRLVGIWNFVRDVQDRGVVAIWEYIESQISNLWNLVLEKAQEWIMERIIIRATVWLLSLLDATGIMPVINTFIAFFNAVQSAIEYVRDILAIVNDYVTTIAAVARGDIQPGAEKMEGGLSNAIPVAIGFLANQFGLGGIGDRIAEIIAGLREMIDAGIDWLLDQAMRLWEGMMSALGFGGEEGEARNEAEAGDEEVDATDHAVVAQRVVQQLEAIDAPDGYAALRAAAEERARAAEVYWSERLEPGIGLTVMLVPTDADAGDADIDFRVTIAPNNAEATGTVSPDGEAEHSSFVGQDASSSDVQDRLVAAGYVRPYQLSSGRYVVRVRPGNPENVPLLTTNPEDGVTIMLASARPEPAPRGEVFFDPRSFVPPPADLAARFDPGLLEYEYRLSRSRYQAGLRRFRPRSGEARRDIEDLLTGAPDRDRRSQEERAADELLRQHGMLPDPAASQDIFDRSEQLPLDELDERGAVPSARDEYALEAQTAMSPGLVQDFLEAYFAHGGWPPGWEVDHAHEVRFGGNDHHTNYAPLPPHDHDRKSNWAGELARAVLDDPEIRAAFEEGDTAEARELNFEP